MSHSAGKGLKMTLLSGGCAVFLGGAAGPSLRAAEPAAPERPAFFAGAPVLELKQSPPLAVASVVAPALMAPASGEAAGVSHYVFGLGRLTEIRLETGEITEHVIGFDRDSRRLYDAGANAAWLGPDTKIYFGLQGRPARIGRFDPGTATMELLGALEGHSVLRHLFGPGDTCYIVTYPATLSELNLRTGAIRGFGRLAADALYVNGDMWTAVDGKLYATAGQRPPRKVSVDLATGVVTELDEFPDVEKVPPPAAAFDSKGFAVTLDASGERATLAIRRAGDEAGPRTVAFTCSTVDRDVETVGLGPDGRVYTCGSYRTSVFDPVAETGEALDFVYNSYDFLNVGDRIFFGGYPNARVGVLDTAAPLALPAQKQLWYLKPGMHNPAELINLWNTQETGAADGQLLKMKRAWSLARGRDGRVYVACSATRQNRGGALVSIDPGPAGPQPVSWREPWFAYLGVSALCEIDGGALLGVVTWTSPDPTAPGKEPAAAKLFLFDVETGTVVHESVPLPGCKVLTAIAQMPGKPLLVGIGLPDVVPTPESDDAFSGDGELFFFDLETRATVGRLRFDFPLNRRLGRPLTPAPDGSLWISAGGGIMRIDPQTRAVTPLAWVGASGNLVFKGNTVFIAGGPSLHYGDASALWQRP